MPAICDWERRVDGFPPVSILNFRANRAGCLLGRDPGKQRRPGDGQLVNGLPNEVGVCSVVFLRSERQHPQVLHCGLDAKQGGRK